MLIFHVSNFKFLLKVNIFVKQQIYCYSYHTNNKAGAKIQKIKH